MTNPTPTLSEDQSDIQNCLNGDGRSFGALVRRHQDHLLRLAFHLLGNWDDAEDAVQETFIKVFHHLDRFDQDRVFSTWILRILVNTCKDRMKSAYWRKRLSLDSVIRLSPNETDVLSRMGNRELAISAFSQLTPKRRQALVLVDIEGYSTREAAQIMHCSESTVRVTLMHARKVVKTLFLNHADE